MCWHFVFVVPLRLKKLHDSFILLNYYLLVENKNEEKSRDTLNNEPKFTRVFNEFKVNKFGSEFAKNNYWSLCATFESLRAHSQ